MAFSKRATVLLVLAVILILGVPALYHLWQIYDPLTSLRGLPEGLSGRLVFYDPDRKAYRYLVLPSLSEGDLDISGRTVDLSFTADGRFAVYRLDRVSYLFDVAAGSDIRLKIPKDAHFVSIAPDGRGIAYFTYHEGRHALVVGPGPVKPSLAQRRIVLDMQPERLSWAHDSSHLYVTTGDDTIATFDLARGEVSRMFPGRFPSRSPKGRFLAYYRLRGKTFQLVFLDTQTATEHVMGPCPAIRPVVWSPDERYILYFEPVKDILWQVGRPAIRLRLYDIFKRGYSTVLRGRNLGLPERLLWIP